MIFYYKNTILVVSLYVDLVTNHSFASVLCVQYPEVTTVPLQSQDIVGLGFNITGSMRDGIFVSRVLNRGPANESGLIEAGLYSPYHLYCTFVL